MDGGGGAAAGGRRLCLLWLVVVGDGACVVVAVVQLQCLVVVKDIPGTCDQRVYAKVHRHYVGIDVPITVHGP